MAATVCKVNTRWWELEEEEDIQVAEAVEETVVEGIQVVVAAEETVVEGIQGEVEGVVGVRVDMGFHKNRTYCTPLHLWKPWSPLLVTLL